MRSGGDLLQDLLVHENLACTPPVLVIDPGKQFPPSQPLEARFSYHEQLPDVASKATQAWPLEGATIFLMASGVVATRPRRRMRPSSFIQV